MRRVTAFIQRLTQIVVYCHKQKAKMKTSRRSEPNATGGRTGGEQEDQACWSVLLSRPLANR